MTDRRVKGTTALWCPHCKRIVTDASTRARPSDTPAPATEAAGSCQGCGRPLVDGKRPPTPLEALWRRLRRLGLAPGAPALLRRNKKTSPRERAGSS